jgi:hypothetical protein
VAFLPGRENRPSRNLRRGGGDLLDAVAQQAAAAATKDQVGELRERIGRMESDLQNRPTRFQVAATAVVVVGALTTPAAIFITNIIRWIADCSC